MKNWKKIFAILVLTFLTLNYSYATWIIATGATDSSLWTGSEITPITKTIQDTNSGTLNILKIEWIDFVDDKSLSLKISESIDGISKDSEVKILEDIWVSSVNKDLDSAKKIVIELNSELVDGSSYSLVSVWEWLDTSIDFNLSWDKTKILNSNVSQTETSIEYIDASNPKKIVAYVNKELSITTFDFKMFLESKVETMVLDGKNLNIKMIHSLQSKKDYIAILALKDSSNKDIEVNNALYDFTTPEFTVATPIVTPSTDVNPTNETPITTEMNPTNTTLTEPTSSSWVSTEELAMKATTTPDTGTQTNVLIIVTFILTLFVFMVRRKNIKM